MNIELYKIVAFSWAGVNLGIMIGFVMGILFFYILNKYFSFEKVTQVDHLKNALLSLALIMTKGDDIDNNLNMNYDSYDGTKLPPFSGYSMENVCLTYIQKNPFDIPLYSKQMDNKQQAIQKYLDKNLDTQSKMIEFFDAFCKKLSEKTEEPKEPNKTDDYEKPITDDEDSTDIISGEIIDDSDY